MDQPKISRSRLIGILLADEPWSPAILHPVTREGDPEIWQHVLGDLAEVQADRLLNPSWTGYLLDRLTVREKMVAVGMTLGAYQISGMPIQVTMSIAISMADVQLVMSLIDLTETRASRWERLVAILTASQAFGIEPTKFLREYAGAQEYILRLYSSPDEFRAHQIERVDAKHPEIVKHHVQVLHHALREEAVKQLGRPDMDVHLQIGFPMGDDYWQMRAWWRQAVEAQIRRVWPHLVSENTSIVADA
ncbi:MAG: hypothetical protein NUV84_00155 [Candidatus Uhrbacteria bacterium]|nr:hypothetical protein [Candidatus Uhrbacteria bacterium]